MTNYGLRRILYTIPVLLAATFIIFMLIHLVPGDPASVIGGQEATQEELAVIRQRLGLDQPLPVQYFYYLRNLLRGDFGRSYYFKEDILKLIVETLPATLELSAVALILSLLVAIPLGVITATHRNSWIDRVSMVGAVIGISIPIFWLGIMLIYLFAVELDWLPASGRVEPLWSVEGLRHIILPAVSLASLMMASTTRLTRAAMLEVLQEDFIRTARAKGLRERSVIYGHALRNALIPVVTNVGLQVGFLLGGSFLTETVFAWPGIGRLSVEAMFRRDYPLVQGTLLMVVFFFVVVNLLVDLLYSVIDPRISYQRSR
jgi:peptide/nickel transport system permease protein